jgi:hypothetical protein
MSHPPKSTIFAFKARCVAFSAVFLSGAAGAGETGLDETELDETGFGMENPPGGQTLPFHDRESPAAGSIRRQQRLA